MNPPQQARSFTTIDPERATQELAREHEALAAMQGADSRRVDRLVDDVGTIKGHVQTLQSDVGRVANGVDDLRDSMAVLNRHAVLMETQTKEIAGIRQDLSELSSRVRRIEEDAPGWRKTEATVGRGLMGVAAIVGLAVLALVIKR